MKKAAISSSPSSPSPSSSTSSRGAALIVVVHHGRRVLGQNRFSSRRPYIVLRTDSTERCTRVTEHKGGLQPVWEEQLYLPIVLYEPVVRIACFNKDQRPRRASVNDKDHGRSDKGDDEMIGLGHWRVDKARETPTGRWHGWILLRNPVTGEGTGEIYISVMYLVSARASSAAGSSGGVAAPEEAQMPVAAPAAPPVVAVRTASTVSVLALSISASSVSSSARSSDTSGDFLDSGSDSLTSTHPDEAGGEAAGVVEKADESEPQAGEENVRRRTLRRVSSSLSTPPCCYRPPRSPTMLKRMKSVASLPAMHLFSGSGETKGTTTTTTTTVAGTRTTAVTETPAVLPPRIRRSTYHSQEDMRASSILTPADRVNDGSYIGIPEEPEDEHGCTHYEPPLLPPQSDSPTPHLCSITTPSDHHEDGDSSETIRELPVLLWLTRPITHEHLVKMAFIDRVCASSTKAQTRMSRRRSLLAQGAPSPTPCWAGASPRTVRWRLSQVFAAGSMAGADKGATVAAS